MVLMKYIISEEILNRTKCEYNFFCLSGKIPPYCMAVAAYDEDKVLTPCAQDYPNCQYCMPFGKLGGYCQCPTRVELFKRYGI